MECGREEGEGGCWLYVRKVYVWGAEHSCLRKSPVNKRLIQDACSVLIIFVDLIFYFSTDENNAVLIEVKQQPANKKDG